jgi:hypothetical protein
MTVKRFFAIWSEQALKTVVSRGFISAARKI